MTTNNDDIINERQVGFGWGVGSSVYGPRGIIAQPEKSWSGNIVLRTGNESPGGGWTQAVHIVLTPAEAAEFIAALQAKIDQP